MPRLADALSTGVDPLISPQTGPRRPTSRYDYVRDGDEIYRRSFATIREESRLASFPPDVARVAVRVIHACGDVDVVDEIAYHPDVASSTLQALRSGASILTDSAMLAAGITRLRLPAGNDVVCTLRDERVPALAQRWDTTRAAAAVSLWEPWLAGAVVAIGNAPTALFHLLELIADGGPRPAAIVGMPVGFVGSAESKTALAEHRLTDAGTGHDTDENTGAGGNQVPWIVVHGRRGGSAMAAAAVNALATEREIL